MIKLIKFLKVYLIHKSYMIANVGEDTVNSILGVSRNNNHQFPFQSMLVLLGGIFNCILNLHPQSFLCILPKSGIKISTPISKH